MDSKDNNGTGDHRPPGYAQPPDDTEPVARRLSWYESMLGRVSHKPMPEKKKESDPVPGYARKSQQAIDFAKYLIALVVGLIAVGWGAHEYIGKFQTEEEASTAQQANDGAHEHMQESIDTQGEALGNIRVYSVRIELEQLSTNDRLEQLLELQTAETRAERREAMEVVGELQDRIERRERIIRSPAALQRVADRVEDDPLGGLEGI